MDRTDGRAKIDWATAHMPLRRRLRDELVADRPFRDRRIAMSIHLEAKTACLAMLLRDAGAEVWVTGSNPLSTQDDVAGALAEEEGIFVRARHGVSDAEYDAHLREVLAAEPDLILDDGGDLVEILHSEPPREILGGCEETTTGVARLRVRARSGTLRFPMFAVNDAQMKYLFDNRYGTGQSTWDAILRSTNLLVAGKEVLVAGYGWCGRGIALRARGLGARVTVAEVDPIRAVEAWMDGFAVAPVREAIRSADFVITATGCADVVTEEVLRVAKDGAVLANAGHFNVEVNLKDLAKLARSTRAVRYGIVEYTLADGRRLYVLAEGRLVNLALGDGHPVEIMDISFAVQALTLVHLVRKAPLPAGLHPVPPEIDGRVASLKLETLGVTIDTLSDAQRAYVGVAQSGA
jgi:adenosylhomocysteinase